MGINDRILAAHDIGLPFFMDAILRSLDRQFASIDQRSRKLLSVLDADTLFKKPPGTPKSIAPFSCGEYILRSAAMVEKTFGGLTTRLWDDPFEWTLPEKLYDRESISGYLDEVEETRKRGFAFLASDTDLSRQIPAPERLTPIIDILIETISRAEHYQGRAFALFQVGTGNKPPRF